MKRIVFFIAITFGLASCDSFLTVHPKDDVAEEAFLKTEKDLEIYANGFIQRYLPSSDNTAFADQYTDYVASRNSTDFLKGDTWTPEDQGGWGAGASGKWAQLRDANWFLDRLDRAKDNISEDIYNHYKGVGRFWRAYFYYDMVRTFGDVPWYDHELDKDEVDELYKGRDSREFVMEKVLEDLNFASTYCSSDARFVNSSTRINRWVALAFKSRVCLFEGTYRKYHTDLNLTGSANKFLEESINASEILMNESPYELETGGAVDTRYRSLFNGGDLNQKEIILGLAYKTDLRMHNVTWKMFSASYGNSWSLTKQFVNQYLMRDGSRFTDQPNWETMSYSEEFKNRDYRLQQTVISPEYTRKVAGVEQKVSPNFTMNLTGYQIIKWAIDDEIHIGLTTSANSLSLLRYAEVLLNYAEAKAELGQMTNEIWNKTIRALRERAGVNGSVPSDFDPYLADYYLNQTSDKWILEIRRERGVELAFEQVRYDDLMRWKMGKLLEIPWKGVYVDQLDKGYDLNGDGVVDFKVSNTSASSATVIKLDNMFQLTQGNKGNVVYGQHLGRLWLDKKYLRPIPTTAIQVNPNLLPQNPGWDK